MRAPPPPPTPPPTSSPTPPIRPLRASLRRGAKWGGIAIAGLCMLIWLVSLRLTLIRTWMPPAAGPVQYRQVAIGNGAVMFLFMNTEAARAPMPGWKWIRRSGKVWWWPQRLDPSTGSAFAHRAGGLAIPMWCFALVSAGIAWGPWSADLRKARRERTGKCRHCRYDLSGLAPGAICPECGAVRENRSSAAAQRRREARLREGVLPPR